MHATMLLSSGPLFGLLALWFVLDCATVVVAQTAVADCSALAQTQWAPLVGWQPTLSPTWCCNSNATGVTCTPYNGSYNVTGLQLSGRNLTGAFHFVRAENDLFQSAVDRL